ncbi:cell division protein FtsZ [Candidatus Woesebacteria bacterium RIFCSPLOWO2_01_FULL_39_23]|uniref:Cell division protein FtsZ n=1 Tax=Candidatus Woesebacteria bacterium RIFCSPHIGHO2_01_FULL_40_22 TaxID=1802499 RepID=A0A1F7YK21_9BACT|nr:MAG: cell division protein FtsZ [Candidatus Woesebacteria bacterium RBG_16_40_11]OGM27622.1 MAG: cell division protein FtsZ [Candidatus Woesebacteria bacterium RIFCSPHIGHO2_01_FULL_40_22]OGM36152.1 MAG: cell division protein FtsZ [Candidatus Woesebacteria bacterium RIFCSPHIGHO2_12_FULL_38_9]OGM62795.1 MAG: cell division protein FtsZ [Candidatus Woesebacteria bacterium RIFCSPLOWO2_01_FULL_39_23]
MALVKPDSGRIAKIKVIGIGGGGGNAVSSMIEGNDIAGVEFISINTDAQVLLANKAGTKLQIGEKLTKGLGVGGDPTIGSQAAEESLEKIKELLVDSDMVFITAGMGGGTGTGASPIVAKLAKETGALTVAVVTKPFQFEGTRRSVVADEGIETLRNEVDTLIVIPNQRLMDVIDRKMTLLEAFKVADSVLGQAVGGIAEIITTPGLINVDFADVRTIMNNAGSALLGIGTGVGENRAQMAARASIASPLLDLSIEGATGVLFNITGGPDLTMFEVDEAAKIISSAADTDANIIFGAVIKNDLADQIRITVVATGFDETRARLAKISQPRIPPIQGVVSESPIQAEKREDKEEEQPPTEGGEDDTFGEKFEIPAFLRRIQ